MGMGFEYWEVGFEKKLGWEMGLVPPLQDPHFVHDHRTFSTPVENIFGETFRTFEALIPDLFFFLSLSVN